MMIVCFRNALPRQGVGVVLLVLTFSALVGCTDDRAPLEKTERLEKQIEELTESVADLKKSHDRVKKLVEALDVRQDLRDKAKGGVQLTIAPTETELLDEQIEVEVTVLNAGKKPFAWDREFSVFMQWHVETDDGTVLEPESFADVESEAPDNWKSRFATVAPGQSLSKRVHLTTGFREFNYGSGFGDEGHMLPIANQKLARFVIPEGTLSVSIRAEYIGVTGAGHPQFGFMHEFNVTAESIGLLQQKVASNTIEIADEPP